jgi:hypothetical protein
MTEAKKGGTPTVELVLALSAGLYRSTTVPGGLADCPTAPDQPGVAFVVDDTRIHVLQS